jgi:hypothetical protein
MITGKLTGIIIFDFSRLTAQHIPYGLTTTVTISRAFYLVAGCRSAPYKFFAEFHIKP